MLSSLCCVLILLLAAETGPRLSDAEFFGAMDPGRSEMTAVQMAAQRQDWPAARKAYAGVFRTRPSPRWFTGREKETPRPARQFDASYADKLLAHQWLWQQDWFNLGSDIDWASNQMNQGESATVEWNASLNRHFHFRQLAEAYRQTGEDKYAAEIVAQMLDWIEDCPVLRSARAIRPTTTPGRRSTRRAAPATPGPTPCMPSCRRRLSPTTLSRSSSSRWWSTRDTSTAGPRAAAIGSRRSPRPCSSSARCCRSFARRRPGAATASSGSTGSCRPTSIRTAWRSSWPWATTTGYWTTSARCSSWRSCNDLAAELPADWLQRMERMYNYQAYACMPNGRTAGLERLG